MSLPGTADGGATARGHVNKKSAWSKDEDRVLREQVRLHGPENWCTISLALPRRSSKSCRLRWCQYLSPALDAVKPFTSDEDALILHYHGIHGNRWSTIAGFLPGRSDNAVKNRWNTVLRKRYDASDAQQQQQPRGPCAAGQASGAAAPTLTLGCLPLFPLESGKVISGHGRGPAPGIPQVLPLPGPGEDVAIVEGGAALECLELFPLAPGDVRDNTNATTSKCVDCGADDPLTELRLGPAVVLDAVPSQAVRM